MYITVSPIRYFNGSRLFANQWVPKKFIYDNGLEGVKKISLTMTGNEQVYLPDMVIYGEGTKKNIRWFGDAWQQFFQENNLVVGDMVAFRLRGTFVEEHVLHAVVNACVLGNLDV